MTDHDAIIRRAREIKVWAYGVTGLPARLPALIEGLQRFAHLANAAGISMANACKGFERLGGRKRD